MARGARNRPRRPARGLDLLPGRRPALVLHARLATRARPADADAGRLRMVGVARADRASRRTESRLGAAGNRAPERTRAPAGRNARALRDRSANWGPHLR